MNFALRFASIFETGEGSGLTRTEIWQAAIKAITSSPMRFIFGWGADTFRLVFPKFKPLAYTHDAGYLSVADNVHDYPLQLAAGDRRRRVPAALRGLRVGGRALVQDRVRASRTTSTG